MEQKSLTLFNSGMNRDLSISKAGQSAVYENLNIRIVAVDQDTLLSVTNERGPVQFNASVKGTVVGGNIIGDTIILFTHASGNTDYIYLISDVWKDAQIYWTGNLNFSPLRPIESVVYYESESVQKIYWVDGINPLRAANIKETITSTSSDVFDVNKGIKTTISATLTKKQSGNARPNGVTQYILTYFDKHGVESGVVWMSDIVYLSPSGYGGSADGTNSCSVQIAFSNIDTSFTNYRVYSIFRSSLDGEVTAYIVNDGETDNTVSVYDDGAHLTVTDASALLYLGSQPVIASTIEQKEGTLFLGNIKKTGRTENKTIENIIKSSMFGGSYPTDGLSTRISFAQDTTTPISYGDPSDLYPYVNTLAERTSQDILSFKGGEKYRFGLQFKYADGTITDAFWIGDKENGIYPKIDYTSGEIYRVLPTVSIPSSLGTSLKNYGIAAMRVMIAQASDADRKIKAQGIVNPTMFNVYERAKNRIYAMPSWVSRPRLSNYTWAHGNSVGKSNTSAGEIQCNWWPSDNVDIVHPWYSDSDTYDEYKDSFISVSAVYEIHKSSNILGCSVTIYKVTEDLQTGFYKTMTAPTWGQVDEEGWAQNDSLIDAVTIKKYSTFIDETTGWSSVENKINQVYPKIEEKLTSLGYDFLIPDKTTFTAWVNYVDKDSTKTQFVNYNEWDTTKAYYTTQNTAFNGNKSATRWTTGGSSVSSNTQHYVYKKQLMFVDENVVTLDSPELSYSKVSDTEGLNFRIVGLARMNSIQSDVTADASSTYLAGGGLSAISFSGIYGAGSNLNGVLSWPMWKENGLTPADNATTIVKDRTSEDYDRSNYIKYYWMYMWQSTGSVDKYTVGGVSYGGITRKIFANMHISNGTEFLSTFLDYSTTSDYQARIVDPLTASQYALSVKGETVYYAPRPQMQLTMPSGSVRYPIYYNDTAVETETASASAAFLYVQNPVTLEYSSDRHAVITLGGSYALADRKYHQKILPHIGTTDTITVPTDAKIPWFDNDEYAFDSSSISYSGTMNQPFLYIGELYRDFSKNDTRYGGPTKEAAQSCLYVAASSWFDISTTSIKADRGDTYIQRWDSMRIKPYSTGASNQVIDITSVLLETHINLDGRTDKQRSFPELASIDTANYGQVNEVYSQVDNFIAGIDSDENLNSDSYATAITWTKRKADMAQTDAWTHITLANSVMLDGDKGECRKLIKSGNQLLAFQDRGIAEVLYNGAVQLSTKEGTPVEIANSGKVNGIRYISNTHGCINKWSITEGSKGIYFIDNINRQFCRVAGNGIDNLSERFGFGVWFRRHNNTTVWNPSTWPNYKVYHDKLYDDIYIVGKDSSEDTKTLCYNERLDKFTSFFSYGSVAYMANWKEHLITVHSGKLWGMFGGTFNNLFGTIYPSYTIYRVAPDSITDRIWTNIDVRADFYKLNLSLDNYPEDKLISPTTSHYLPDEFFTELTVWNEYQSTSVKTGSSDLVKRFRTWHYSIPRNLKSMNDKGYGYDRMRNPWVFFKLEKTAADTNPENMMQLHDVTIRYYE